MARVRGLASAVEVGRRVFLRHPVRADRDDVMALRRASWSFLRPWEPTPPTGEDPCGPVWFSRFLGRANTDGEKRFFLCRRADGLVMGAVALNAIARGVLQSACLGYWIGEPYQRRGYMSAGVELALRHAFRKLRLHRLEANIQPENRRSIALVRRLGFRKEGLSPRYLKIAGRWKDHERWAILAEEWPSGAGGGSSCRH